MEDTHLQAHGPCGARCVRLHLACRRPSSRGGAQPLTPRPLCRSTRTKAITSTASASSGTSTAPSSTSSQNASGSRTNRPRPRRGRRRRRRTERLAAPRRVALPGPGLDRGPRPAPEALGGAVRLPPVARAPGAPKAVLLQKPAPSRVEMPPPSRAPPGARDPHACLLLATPRQVRPRRPRNQVRTRAEKLALLAPSGGGIEPHRLACPPPRHTRCLSSHAMGTPEHNARQSPSAACSSASPARHSPLQLRQRLAPGINGIFLWFLPDMVCGHGVASLCLFVCYPWFCFVPPRGLSAPCLFGGRNGSEATNRSLLSGLRL